jgi:polyferredoxin
MDRIERPRGLIDWTTLAADAAAARREKPVFRLLRSRTIIYAALLVLVAGVMIVALSLRATVEVNVLRDRSPQFVTLSDGAIRNGYTIKILNKTRNTATYRIGLTGVEGAILSLPEGTPATTSIAVTVNPDSVGTFTLYVRAGREALRDKFQTVEVTVTDETGQVVARRSTVFAGPG